MHVIDILRRLKEHQIDISFIGGNLQVKSDSAQLPPALLEEIKQNKEALISYLKQMQIAEAEEMSIPEAAGTLPFYPASSAQKRLYFLQELVKDSTAYNMPMIHFLGENADQAKIETTFRRLIDRHESLRTRFQQRDGKIYQVIEKTVPFALDKHTCTPDEFHTYLQQYIRPFDLAQFPLLRSSLVHITDVGYVWVIDIHHILTDGISNQVLITDFFKLYNNEPLPPLRIQYKDFSVWQNELTGSEILEKQKAYWQTLLSGNLPKLHFAVDHPRPSYFNFKGANINIVLDETVTRQLEAFNKKHRSTLQMTILSVMNVLFHKYLGQDEFIIGCGIAGRNHKELTGVVGMFVNSLPIRNKLSAGQSFLTFHKQVAENCLTAYENQDIQFEEMVELLKIERDASRNPVFDVALMIQNFDHAATDENLVKDAGNGTATLKELLAHRSKGAKLDMAWFVNKHKNEIIINLEYYAAIFEESTMQRLADHFIRVLNTVLADPAIRIADITLMSEAEKEMIFTRFVNGIQLPYQEEQTVHTLFDQQAALTPERIAVTDVTGFYTYEELKKRAGIFAAFLTGLGVGTESKVALLQRRSKDLIVSILGIMKAGAAYVPLDSDHPALRMQYILEDTGARVLVTDEIHKQTALSLQENTGAIEHLINVDESDSTVTANGKYQYDARDIRQAANLPVVPNKATKHHLAYIMYTSGSTGKPKGVQVEHKGILRLVKPAGYIQLNGEEILLSTMAPSFDFSTFEYWSMLLNGGRLVMCTKDDLLDTRRLTGMLVKNKVNTLMLSAGLLNQLVDTDIDIFSGLKTLLAGGEKLSLRHMQALGSRFPDLEMINAYGPTEDTSIALTHTMKGSPGKILIGKPIHNTSVYIIDQAGHLCPVGIAGEIYLGGEALARGYLNLEALTNERFIAHPFVQGEKLYKTGDIGKWLPDGNVEFLGRQDDQIKVRGFRVEPGEIEAAIQAYPEVDSAVVIADLASEGSYELKAYFVARKPTVVAELKTHLRSILPFYMIPAFVMQVPVLPLTISGKVDKKKLLGMAGANSGSNEHSGYPTTPTQWKLLDIFNEQFTLDRISIYDNFFEIGGHSLGAMKLVSDIKKAFKVDVQLENIFSNPTIEYIAAEIDKIKGPQENTQEPEKYGLIESE
jgi:amino acid adenylation domain-containing protein